MSRVLAGESASVGSTSGRGVSRYLWSGAGTFFLCLGLVAIAIPLLPTTPFLLLAAACYVRGSARMHAWMLTNRVFGPYLSNYAEGRGIPLKVKVGTVSLLWAVIGLSAVVATDDAVIRALLLVIAVAVSVHILRIGVKKHNRGRIGISRAANRDATADSRGPF